MAAKSASPFDKSSGSSTTSYRNVELGPQTMPICIIVVGMAGSGKTTFVRKLTEVSYEKQKPYVINLDPACRDVPPYVNIDIRDTVNYKQVMKQYKLGPNGAIVTSLNLFTTKMEKVIELVKRAGENGHKWCIIDTPGQIEVFTWSASGGIITEAFATMFPTVVVYVMDVVRSICPTTFMSNMLYGCSILYKSTLPFLIAINKIDLQDPAFIHEWMTDFEVFHEALEKQQTYVSNLSRHMSLTLDTFYENLKTCTVSSVSGIGFTRFMELIAEAAEEYEKDYKVEFTRLRLEKLKINNDDPQKAGAAALANLSNFGTEVPLQNKFVEDKPMGSEVAEVFLRFPETELDEDTENDILKEQTSSEIKEQMEEQNFQEIMAQRKTTQRDKLEKA